MSDSDFISKGYELYADAALAMTTFQQEIVRRLKASLASRQKWGPFVPKPGGRADVGGSREHGWYIWATQHGMLGKGKAKLELGYWWNPPFQDRKPVLYSCFFEEPEELLNFRYDGSVPGVEAVTVFDHTRIISPMPRDLEPQEALSRHLDVLVRVMNGG